MNVPEVDPVQVNERSDRLILDVREDDEVASGTIAGAVHIPLKEILVRLEEIPRDQEVVTVCRSGRRSLDAAEQLIGQGYTASSMAGGMIGWQEAGLPTATR